MADKVSYAWKPGHKFHTSADVVGKRLEMLRRKHKVQVLQTRAVVDDAESPSSPLHPEFEWDDARCGQLYREGQARQLIRCLTIIVEPEEETRAAPTIIGGTPEPPITRLPAYVHVRSSDGQGYTTLETAMNDPTMLKSVQEQFWRDLQALRSRYVTFAAEYQQVAQWIAQLDDILAQRPQAA